MVLQNAFPTTTLFLSTSALPPGVYPPRPLFTPIFEGCSDLRARRLPRPGRGVALFSSTLSLSSDCGLFVSLAALFADALLCFQSFADSFAKNRGVGVAAHSSALLTIHCSLPTFWFIRRP